MILYIYSYFVTVTVEIQFIKQIRERDHKSQQHRFFLSKCNTFLFCLQVGFGVVNMGSKEKLQMDVQGLRELRAFLLGAGAVPSSGLLSMSGSFQVPHEYLKSLDAAIEYLEKEEDQK